MSDHSIESDSKYNVNSNCTENGSANNNDVILGTMILQKYEVLQNEFRNYKYKILRLRHRVYDLERDVNKLENENVSLKNSQTIKWISLAVNMGLIAYVTKLILSE